MKKIIDAAPVIEALARWELSQSYSSTQKYVILAVITLLEDTDEINVYGKLLHRIRELKTKQNENEQNARLSCLPWNQDYYVGYMSALSTVEGIIAEMQEGEQK